MERWRQIESVFHEALERPHSEREAYVRHACAGDRELHREVTSLLASHNDDAESTGSPGGDREGDCGWVNVT